MNRRNGSAMAISAIPDISGNYRLIIGENDDMFLTTYNATNQLGDVRFANLPVKKSSDLASDLYRLFDFGRVNPETVMFKRSLDMNTVASGPDTQYDSFYSAGIRELVVGGQHGYTHAYSAPLILNPTDIPDGFLLLKKKPDVRADQTVTTLVEGIEYIVYQGDIEYEGMTYNNGQRFTATNTSSYISNGAFVVPYDADNWARTPYDRLDTFLQGAEIVNYWDMRQSNFGTYLDNHVRNIARSPIYYRPQSGQMLFHGINYRTAEYINKPVDFQTLYDPTLSAFEQNVHDVFSRNGIISSHLLNLEFAFTDNRDPGVWEYFGLYVDKETLGTFYPTIRSGKITEKLELSGRVAPTGIDYNKTIITISVNGDEKRVTGSDPITHKGVTDVSDMVGGLSRSVKSSTRVQLGQGRVWKYNKEALGGILRVTYPKLRNGYEIGFYSLEEAGTAGSEELDSLMTTQGYVGHIVNKSYTDIKKALIDSLNRSVGEKTGTFFGGDDEYVYAYVSGEPFDIIIEADFLEEETQQIGGTYLGRTVNKSDIDAFLDSETQVTTLGANTHTLKFMPDFSQPLYDEDGRLSGFQGWNENYAVYADRPLKLSNSIELTFYKPPVATLNSYSFRPIKDLFPGSVWTRKNHNRSIDYAHIFSVRPDKLVVGQTYVVLNPTEQYGGASVEITHASVSYTHGDTFTASTTTYEVGSGSPAVLLDSVYKNNSLYEQGGYEYAYDEDFLRRYGQEQVTNDNAALFFDSDNLIGEFDTETDRSRLDHMTKRVRFCMEEGQDADGEPIMLSSHSAMGVNQGLANPDIKQLELNGKALHHSLMEEVPRHLTPEETRAYYLGEYINPTLFESEVYDYFGYYIESGNKVSGVTAIDDAHDTRRTSRFVGNEVVFRGIRYSIDVTRNDEPLDTDGYRFTSIVRFEPNPDGNFPRVTRRVVVNTVFGFVVQIVSLRITMTNPTGTSLIELYGSKDQKTFNGVGYDFGELINIPGSSTITLTDIDGSTVVNSIRGSRVSTIPLELISSNVNSQVYSDSSGLLLSELTINPDTGEFNPVFGIASDNTFFFITTTNGYTGVSTRTIDVTNTTIENLEGDTALQLSRNGVFILEIENLVAVTNEDFNTLSIRLDLSKVKFYSYGGGVNTQVGALRKATALGLTELENEGLTTKIMVGSGEFQSLDILNLVNDVNNQSTLGNREYTFHGEELLSYRGICKEESFGSMDITFDNAGQTSWTSAACVTDPNNTLIANLPSTANTDLVNGATGNQFSRVYGTYFLQSDPVFSLRPVTLHSVRPDVGERYYRRIATDEVSYQALDSLPAYGQRRDIRLKSPLDKGFYQVFDVNKDRGARLDELVEYRIKTTTLLGVGVSTPPGVAKIMSATPTQSTKQSLYLNAALRYQVSQYTWTLKIDIYRVIADRILELDPEAGRPFADPTGVRSEVQVMAEFLRYYYLKEPSYTIKVYRKNNSVDTYTTGLDESDFISQGFTTQTFAEVETSRFGRSIQFTHNTNEPQTIGAIVVLS